ncbi:MAG: bifunctional diaminohydroxyphosphoribosylaminopyrimidine deaminase/5-amino-6-(5-phosphoribosylamino)uracil reductase RibD [Ferruginibacter sp.]
MRTFEPLQLHESYMQRCFQLARLGAGKVAPNPMVGAVLVYEDKIIGEGYHEAYGGPHAEVNCVASVAKENWHLIAKSTLYVSLEPCSHFGKTPPCTDLIIKERIPKVVIAGTDAHKMVNGQGVQRLRNHGIEVITGILEQEAIALNAAFFTFHQKQRPYIILKWAQSNDGFIGKLTERVHISNVLTNRMVHQWRSEVMGIMVGTNTVRVDNPHLTARIDQAKNPIRITVDQQLSLPVTSNIFDGTVPTYVYNEIKASIENNVHYRLINMEQHLMGDIFADLFQLGIQSVLVEGGASLLQSCIDQDYWDVARVISNTSLHMENGVKAPLFNISKQINQQFIQNDCITYYQNPKA